MITPKQARELTDADLELAKSEERRIDDLLRGFEDKQHEPYFEFTIPSPPRSYP